MHSSRSSSPILELLLLGIVLVVAVAWLLVKATELTVRVVMAYPDNKVLRYSLIAAGVCVALAVVAWGRVPLLTVPAVLSLGVLVAVAKCVELYNDRRLQTPLTAGDVVTSVLKQPWWDTAQPLQMSKAT